jgi:hypothetical protein
MHTPTQSKEIFQFPPLTLSITQSRINHCTSESKSFRQSTHANASKFIIHQSKARKENTMTATKVQR